MSAYHAKSREKPGEESQPTHYFRWNEQQVFHLDYCFAPKIWSVSDVRVGSYDSCSDLSDHRPLCVDFLVPGT